MTGILTKKPAMSLVLGFLAIVLIGCSYTADRRHASFSPYVKKIKTILLLPPQAEVFERMSDGHLLWQESGSQKARELLSNEIANRLTGQKINVRRPDAALMKHPDMQSLQALFRAVNRSIKLHVYSHQYFPSKAQNFDYQLGSVADLLEKSGADAIVLAVGQQTLSESRTDTWLSMALVESKGQIVWYNLQIDRVELGLQRPEEVKTLVRRVLDPLRSHL